MPIIDQETANGIASLLWLLFALIYLGMELREAKRIGTFSDEPGRFWKRRPPTREAAGA